MAKPSVASYFATQIYRGRLAGAGGRHLLDGIEATSRAIAEEDRAGQRWCREHRYEGYTSYASLDDLTTRASVFADLEVELDRHVAVFSRMLDLDLAGRRLALDSIWINIHGIGGRHPSHIHPGSVISGTLYVTVPPGAGAIRYEDPRLPMMMAAPARKASARPANRTHVEITPAAGSVLLWESWLRHEVTASRSRRERISVSFNYALHSRGRG